MGRNGGGERKVRQERGKTLQDPGTALQGGLYSEAERQRRDETPWTLVQGILAPIQFVVFLVSLALVLRYLMSGEGFLAASLSIVAKTLILYVIMVTGSIWEKKVFGRYLFAPAFFWEDMVSMLVLALHTLYLAAFALGWFTPEMQMAIALAAYAAYAVNAAQFLIKFRMARRDRPASSPGLMEPSRS
jgi:3-vinyl bacteriochlorophyllide hydratase